MAKFLFGVLVGVVVAVLIGVLSLLTIGKLFGHKQPVISPNAVLVLGITGDIPERARRFCHPFPAITRCSYSHGHLELLSIELPPIIESVHIDSAPWVDGGLGKARGDSARYSGFQEVRKTCLRASAKPGLKEYYLGSAADRIYLSPDDYLEVKGFRIEETYYKNTLDKLGVGVEVDHIGRYKDAGEPYTRTGMSPESRGSLNQVLDQLYGDFCSTVGAARHKSADAIRSLIDEGPFTAAQARSAGLVDELGYEDDVFNEIKKSRFKGVEPATVAHLLPRCPKPWRSYCHVSWRRRNQGRRDGRRLWLGGLLIASGAFSKLVRQVRDDKSIKGVIVRVELSGRGRGCFR